MAAAGTTEEAAKALFDYVAKLERAYAFTPAPYKLNRRSDLELYSYLAGGHRGLMKISDPQQTELRRLHIAARGWWRKLDAFGAHVFMTTENWWRYYEARK
jgi:hypothetical protein